MRKIRVFERLFFSEVDEREQVREQLSVSRAVSQSADSKFAQPAILVAHEGTAEKLQQILHIDRCPL